MLFQRATTGWQGVGKGVKTKAGGTRLVRQMQKLGPMPPAPRFGVYSFHCIRARATVYAFAQAPSEHGTPVGRLHSIMHKPAAPGQGRSRAQRSTTEQEAPPATALAPGFVGAAPRCGGTGPRWRGW